MLIQHNLARTHRLVSCRSAGGLLDHLIGTGEQNRWQAEAKSFCSLWILTSKHFDTHLSGHIFHRA